MLLTLFDFAGTFVFALSGATAGVRRRLDLFGVLVLGFAAASAGGILRDVLIGALPPVAIRDWAYPVIAGAAGLVVPQQLFQHTHPTQDRSPEGCRLLCGLRDRFIRL